ncbi:tRNA wybutosine-synthesizing protein 3 homolog isoform X2 [Bacillus rossius redtenbacheri]|uniref:tRNA wybutosine-synthesizing protein 3 homolog isoform X2 n=1 Tax=Bacillus rossius redtenbacheri TaxID=93214 RepID=UPI002FDCDC00
MTPETFKHHKDQVLQGVDLSRKGCVDEPIKQLVEFINGLEDFVTTSSCSGRAILFCEGGSNKKGCRWLYTSHGAAEEGTLVASANPAHGSLVLKYEPLILHVQCLSVERAKTMAPHVRLGLGLQELWHNHRQEREGDAGRPQLHRAGGSSVGRRAAHGDRGVPEVFNKKSERESERKHNSFRAIFS